MPIFIPFLIGGAAIVLAGAGAKKGVKGVADLRHANELVEGAKERHALATRNLEATRDETNASAEAYAEFQAMVVSTTLKRWVELIERMRRRGKLRDVETLAGIDISPQRIASQQTSVLQAESFLKGGASAVMAGAAAGKGAAALVGIFGAAGTGTAISGLTGVAAQNAMLAWLGGGSLASGGFGIAGGTLVLGGVVVAPAIAIMGFTLATQGEKALTAAEHFSAEVDKKLEEIDTARGFLGAVRTRISELRSVLGSLHVRADAALSRLNPERFDIESDEDVRVFQAAGQLVAAVSEVVRTPILTPDNKLTAESAEMNLRFRHIMGDA
jgi:flagellin-like hook-associated protein FlgL